jgi:AcrR family transcriptional regulator
MLIVIVKGRGQVMTDARPGSRERMVSSTVALIRRRGLTGTGFAEVIAHSGAPRGSIYHHFPGGKKQLAQAAVERTAEQVDQVLRTLPATSAPELIDGFIGIWQQVLSDDPGVGCPVAGTVLDTDDSMLLDTAREAFARWRGTLTDRLGEVGVLPDRAPALATMVVAAMEGALVLCRAERSTAPLRVVAEQLKRLA